MRRPRLLLGSRELAARVANVGRRLAWRRTESIDLKNPPGRSFAEFCRRLDRAPEDEEEKVGISMR